MKLVNRNHKQQNSYLDDSFIHTIKKAIIGDSYLYLCVSRELEESLSKTEHSDLYCVLLPDQHELMGDRWFSREEFLQAVWNWSKKQFNDAEDYWISKGEIVYV